MRKWFRRWTNRSESISFACCDSCVDTDSRGVRSRYSSADPAGDNACTECRTDGRTVGKHSIGCHIGAGSDCLFAEQIFSGADGDIHYSYYLPDSYDGSRKFPMMVVMPGYNMMWFGEDSSGSNLNWNGFTAWTRLDTEMVVVSAQLTDWGEKSARQAIELTEYFINRFAVDTSRVYAAGYSAGGETMSQAVALRPDLYAAYLHGASQWDGSYAPIAENSVAIYIYMADGDEYYGSAKARSAYENLHEAYENAGWSDADIDQVLRIETPDNAFFNEKGIYNYHGGANVVFDDPDNLNWVISHSKG